MNHLVLTCTGTPADLVMLEPTLEALYYKHAPARVILRTNAECAPILENHPLVAHVVVDPNYAFGMWGGHPGHRQGDTAISIFNARAKLLFGVQTGDESYHYDFNQVPRGIETSRMHAFANFADVKLLKQTPSLGNYRHTIGMPQRHLYIDLPPSMRELLPTAEIEVSGYTLSVSRNEESVERKVQALKKVEMCISNDQDTLHLAHALGVRKILALYDPELPVSMQAQYPNVRSIPYRGVMNVYQQELCDQVKAALVEPKYPQELNRGNACEWIKNLALSYCHGKGLDVGSNRAEWALPGATPSDHESRRFSEGPFDYIFSSHCLEHITEWKEELKIWYGSLKTNGTVFIYVPHPAMEHWQPEGDWVKGGWHVWSPEPVELVKHLQEETGFKVEAYSTYPDHAWGFWVAARKL